MAADARRGGGAAATLATVLGYVQARVVESACRHVPVPREAVGANGLVGGPAARAAIAETLDALAAAAAPVLDQPSSEPTQF